MQRLQSGLVMMMTLLASAARAQSGMGAMQGMSMPQHQPVSSDALRQIKRIEAETRAFDDSVAAERAGYIPVFGWIPTMGVHWVDRARMTKGQQTQAAAPDNLMYSRIGGRDSLVGAAYAYFGAESDTTTPRLFDGAPPWHEHPDLAPPGETLTMLHVWFVPSPDGPFAGTNPNLPYWALGLAAPDSMRMRDPVFSARARRAALALAEVADTMAILPNLGRRPEVAAVIGPRRDSIRPLIPQLRAAERSGDASAWDRTADRLAAQWDAMHAAYVAWARTTDGRARIQRFIAMLMGEHGHE